MENNELDEIIKENTPRLQSFVRGRVDNRDDADDIVQDTLYQFLRTIRVIENPIAHVSAWLYTVAHNLIINHGKKHREASDFMSELSEILVADDADSPDTRLLRAMVWDELDKALMELPNEQREAIVMTELNGMSVKEAARSMGVSQNTFLSRKHYAVVHIRQRLYKLYEELLKK